MEEEAWQPDVTYVTERVIAVFGEDGGTAEACERGLRAALRTLRSKHGNSLMLVNLAQKHQALRRANQQVLDTGWVDPLAPGLDQVLGVCRLMENWLQSHPNNVLALLCEGARGLCGVAVASYVHFSSVSASADLSLDHQALRRFYCDRLSGHMTPSQRRYVWMLEGVLKGTLRTGPAPTFLHCVVLHSLPKIRPDGGESSRCSRPPPPPLTRPRSPACSLFLRVYQGLQPVCTSAVHHVSAGPTHRLHMVLQPAPLLKGDVLVVCYEKNSWLHRRQVVFRLQVHTGLLPSHQVTFSKWDLDCACDDPRFPADGRVQLLFSERPEEGAGRQLWHNSGAVTVDYDPLDPLLHRDSYQDSGPDAGEAAQVLDCPHGGVFASVRKRSGGEAPAVSPPALAERSPSASSDSGLSVGSQGGTCARQRPGPEEGAPAGRQVYGAQVEVAQPLLDIMAELAAAGRGEVLTTGETPILEARVAGSKPGPAADDVTARSAAPQDLSSLSTDVDESIEQLNQLILDLDPTFVPVLTRRSPQSRSTSVRGASPRSGWRQQKQLSDVTDYAGRCSPGWPGGGAVSFSSPAPSSQQRVEDPGHSHSSEAVPPTPAFPLTPPTPYVRSFSPLQLHQPPEEHAAAPDSRGFLNSAAPGDSEGQVLGAQVSGKSAPCQRLFGSGHSPEGTAPRPNSGTPPAWLDSLTSSDLGTPEEGRDSADFSSLLANGDLERLLLEGLGTPPVLPQKKRGASELGSVSGLSSPHSGSSLSLPLRTSTPDTLAPGSGTAVTSPAVPSSRHRRIWVLAADLGGKQDTVKFVQDTSRFWYKPDISRDQAIAALKDKDPGSFLVRDSHSFRGAYGLAMKVATPPPSVTQHGKRGDPASELVRHFLIECSAKGVRLKGCPEEPYFGSLTALVCQHSITALALPCRLILPDRDPLEDTSESAAQTTTNSAAELLRQGAACNVWFLGSVELESLTGHQAVQKAATLMLAMDPPPPSTVVHFKVSAQGLTLTDNQRKLFFRRHYAVNTVIFCSLDPQGRKWRRGGSATAKIFGFVARKSQSETENVCHLFAEHDPEQPASAIVNFVSKVMIGSHKK
ncbi:tensin-3-like isoform X2 [Synchiropus splendidus]|uniref:tensin-3-like isoform X2 n=1 Tax=Synchiropus splendidus TaxID=270530 RepID=UPI00237D703E|nr:tensin-3-like isoform X2 [Synchiropus splendidus]